MDKLYQFLTRSTNSTFNQVVLKRMFMSWTNRPPQSLSQMICKMKLLEWEGKTAGVSRVPKLKVCALRVTGHTHIRILKAGGKILTYDLLSLDFPKGCGTVLLSGPAKAGRCTGILARP